MKSDCLIKQIASNKLTNFNLSYLILYEIEKYSKIQMIIFHISFQLDQPLRSLLYKITISAYQITV